MLQGGHVNWGWVDPGTWDYSAITAEPGGGRTPWAPRIVPVASYCIKLPSVTLTASLFLVIGLVPETVAITRTLTQVDFNHLYITDIVLIRSYKLGISIEG